MSLKDDLLRNRKVFELLTAPETDGTDLAADYPESAGLSVPFASEIQEPVRQSLYRQEGAVQNIETFSLESGRRVIRETGMALSPVSLKSIEFPTLTQPAEPTFPDPVENLFQQLETAMRRTSQLLGEEE